MVRAQIRSIILVLPLALAAAPAAWSGGAPSKAAVAEVGPPAVDMPPLFVPVTQDGVLKYYAYAVIGLELTSDFKKPIVLEKMPYLQDALLRDVHKAPVAPAEGPASLDDKALAIRLKAVAEGVLGPDVLANITFRTITRAQN